MKDFTENDKGLSQSADKAEYSLPVAEMYPDLTPEQQAEVEHYLTQYFEVINSVFEEKYGLTSFDLNATFKSSIRSV